MESENAVSLMSSLIVFYFPFNLCKFGIVVRVTLTHSKKSLLLVLVRSFNFQFLGSSLSDRHNLWRPLVLIFSYVLTLITTHWKHHFINKSENHHSSPRIIPHFPFKVLFIYEPHYLGYYRK